MNEQTLMLIEATGIQPYIFGSNQLAQNIGASELVTQATTDWVSLLLPKPNNMMEGRVADASLEDDDLVAEVVYARGGNAMILFANDAHAREFAQKLTRTVLAIAPGLNLVLKRQRFDSTSTVLSDLHQDLRAELARRKVSRQGSIPLPGLGVTAACVYTGDPAVVVRVDQPTSAEVAAKLSYQSAGNQRLAAYLPQVQAKGYDFIYDFDHLGSKQESSYLAVIHTDGNSMGERIKALGRGFDEPSNNREYIRALRRFSESVQGAAEAALKSTVDMLLDLANLVDGKLGGVVPIPVHQGVRRLPFRPIVFGGDDVTFVCEGRLGLSTAAKYLAEFSSHVLADGRRAHARAGVAIVYNHYPFSRAYSLSEDLVRSAKRYIRQADPEGGVSALDWHFAVSGLLLPLDELREREYEVPSGSLLMRPVRLSDPDADWRSWQTLTRIMAEFQKPEQAGGLWAGRRNKIMALREVLRDGRDPVRLFLQGVESDLPDIPGLSDMAAYGWQGGRCGYFDAVEALDFYVPLKGGVTG